MRETKKVKLTQAGITEALKDHQPGTRTRIWFEGCNGLHISVSAKGVATYCLRYSKPAGGTGDWSLGRVSMLKPDQAKKAASEALLKLQAHGIDPCDERRRNRSEAKAGKQ